MVLEHSNQPLSLRRVPPNLLVGQGATDFAFDQGFAVLPHDALVSPSARERWLKWRADLKKVECEDGVEIETITQGNEIDLQYEAAVQMQQRRDHTRAMAAGTIETPEQSPPTPSGSAMDTSSPDSRRPLTRSVADSPHPPGSPEEQPHGSLLGPTPWAKGVLSESRHSDQGAATYAHNQGRDGTASLLEGGNVDDEMTGVDDGINFSRREWHNSGRHDGSSESGSWTDSSDDTDGTIQLPSASPSPPPFAALHTRLPDSPPEGTTEMPIDTPLEHVVDAASLPHPDNLRSHMPSVDITDTRQDIEERADLIIDTVGAIAIDCYGNISAGSSSGGIGMKHRGRTGPAALVGVGTAVVPIDPTDKQKTCVGVVTSGTGEHMATTMAAGVCADRLYSSVRKKNGGGLEVVGEDHCIRGVIEKDFMGMFPIYWISWFTLWG